MASQVSRFYDETKCSTIGPVLLNCWLHQVRKSRLLEKRLRGRRLPSPALLGRKAKPGPSKDGFAWSTSQSLIIYE